ncbi:hypothetical protein, partial [Klebsiella pneumoniae]|uniref:hypothetical protein n=1 Tax=Klebsiella pneumoniae TaxID=573 RepID=UPI00194EF090
GVECFKVADEDEEPQGPQASPEQAAAELPNFVGVVIGQLEESSAWLSRAGFRKPRVEPVNPPPGGAWIVRLCPERLHS